MPTRSSPVVRPWAPRHRVGHGARRPFRDNPRLILARHHAAAGGARRAGLARRPSPRLSRPDFLADLVLYALSRPTSRCCSRWASWWRERHQVHRRASTGAAVRALPRQARRPDARHDDRACRAVLAVGALGRADRCRSLVQHADGRDARVGNQHRGRLLPERQRVVTPTRRRAWPAACRGDDPTRWTTGRARRLARPSPAAAGAASRSTAWSPAAEAGRRCCRSWTWRRRRSRRLGQGRRRSAGRARPSAVKPPWMFEPVPGGGDDCCVWRTPIRPDGPSVGVVVATRVSSPARWPTASRRMTQAYEDYTQLRVLRSRWPVCYVSLRHGDAVHPRRLDVDGPLPRQADYAVRADAVDGGTRNRRRALVAPYSALRPMTSSATWADAFNAMAAEVASQRRRRTRVSPKISRAAA